MQDNSDGLFVCLYLSLCHIIMKSDLCLDIDLDTNKQADSLTYGHTDMTYISTNRHIDTQIDRQTITPTKMLTIIRTNRKREIDKAIT